MGRIRGSEKRDRVGKGMRSKRLGGGGLCGRWSTASGEVEGTGSDGAGNGMRSKRLGGGGLCSRRSTASGEGQRRQGSESERAGRSKRRGCTRRRGAGEQWQTVR